MSCRRCPQPPTTVRRATTAIAALCAALLAACASSPMPEHVGPPAKEQIVAVSASHHLLRFNAGQPQNVRDRRPLQGLRSGERLLGIDYRVAHGQLFALGASGQLYRIDVAQAQAVPVGTPVALPPGGREWGFDFNPAVDRIRVVADNGVNLRLHPETGALIDSDPATPGVQLDGTLAYDAADSAAGKAPRIVAAAYTYNQANDKITTNYAIDAAAGTLVHQGTKEGVTPAVSPNTGRLYTVGALGIGAFDHAVFDISDVGNVAYAGVHPRGARATRWYRLDLASGRAAFLGTVGGGEPLLGAAIEP
jgi:hypothetical protein